MAAKSNSTEKEIALATFAESEGNVDLAFAGDDTQANEAAALEPASFTELVESDEAMLIKLAKRANDINKRGVELFLDLSDILSEAHRIHCRVGREGEFGAWTRKHLPDLSQRTAERMVRVHAVFGRHSRTVLAKFEQTALYTLCEEKTPASARDIALKKAANGFSVTAALARKLVGVFREDVDPVDDVDPVKGRAMAPARIHTRSGEVIVRPIDGVLDVKAALKEAVAKQV